MHHVISFSYNETFYFVNGVMKFQIYIFMFCYCRSEENIAAGVQDNGSKVLRVHSRIATARVRKLRRSVDEYRAASFGELCELLRTRLAVPPRRKHLHRKGIGVESACHKNSEFLAVA